MKMKAPSLLKKLIAALSSKTNELRIRMTIFFLLHKNIDRTSLTQSLHALVSHHPNHHRKKKNDDAIEEEQQLVVEDGQDEEEEEEGEKESKCSLLMNYNKASGMMVSNTTHMRAECEEANYDDEERSNVDLTHALFKESEAEMEMEGGESEEEMEGVEMMCGVVDDEVPWQEEEDIDQAADLFIQRFKKQILLQKQRSLGRQQRLVVSNA